MTNEEAALAEGCYFDTEAATRAVTFVETYCIPSTIGKPIKLLPWQAAPVQHLFGWKRPGGRNRFKRATISTAKKNGKTVLVSAMLGYGLLGGICTSPFVASASTSRENAGQVYRELANSFKKHSKLSRKGFAKLLDSYKEIRVPSKAARYRAFSADAGAAEGENLSLCVVDETHAHVSNRLYRSLEYSTIARPDGLFINISTAGDDQGHFWHDVFRYALQVQRNEIIDTSLFPYICTIPDEADIDDPKNWYLSNPSLGVSFSEEEFKQDLDRAKAGGTADLLSFRRYRLNQWCRAEDSYIDPAKFDACTKPLTDAELSKYPLWLGLDGSSTTDPASLSAVWALPDRKFYVQSWGWVCDEGCRKREASNLPKYRTFTADGCMTILPGDVIDPRAIRRKVMELKATHQLKQIVCDQSKYMETLLELQAQGVPVLRQPQSHKYYSDPMKEFSAAVIEGRVQHDGRQSWLRWALQNTRIDLDSSGNCKPDRDKSTDKVDATFSTLMAFGQAYIANVTQQTRVYRGTGEL